MGEPTAWQTHRLDNGAQLLLAPLAGRASVAVSLLIRVGSRWESTRLAGISHFLEHMVFKGTERFPTSRDVSQSIEGVGGVLNASTDKELTSYWARVPERHLELALGLLLDMVLCPRLLSQDSERERNVVLEELRMYRDQPSDLVHMLFDSLLYGSHPLARDPVGTQASLERIGAGELGAYRASHYLPERMVVVVAGAFAPQRALAAVRRSFAERGWDRGSSPGGPGQPKRQAPAPPRAPAAVRVRRRAGEQVHLLVGVRCHSYLSPDRWALDVLSTILGEGMSSRLFLEIREKEGLAYDIHSFAARYRDSGGFGIYLATRPDQTEQALAGALRQVRRLLQETIGPEDLSRARNQIEGHLALQLEGTGALSEFLGHQAALMDSVMSPSEVIRAVRGVSSEAVRDAAQTLFAQGGWRVAAVGPRVDAAGLEAAIGRELER
ncbi:MAG: M16 family metallopeptidase [Candidatus Dormibacteria bacterium]